MNNEEKEIIYLKDLIAENKKKREDEGKELAYELGLVDCEHVSAVKAKMKEKHEKRLLYFREDVKKMIERLINI